MCTKSNSGARNICLEILAVRLGGLEGNTSKVDLTTVVEPYGRDLYVVTEIADQTRDNLLRLSALSPRIC